MFYALKLIELSKPKVLESLRRPFIEPVVNNVRGVAQSEFRVSGRIR